MRARVIHDHDNSDRAGSGIRSRVALALWLTVGFVVIEASAGFLANSLALLMDATHNLTDVAALALSLLALGWQSRPASPERTYGFHRVGILVAVVNSSGLLVMSLLVLFAAYRRLLEPADVRAWPLMAVGAAALMMNLVTALLIHRPGERDLNLRSTFLHLMGDVASTAAAVAAGVGIYLTGANWLDPAASAIIAMLILVGAWRVLREAVGILLEATPPDVNMNALVGDILSVRGILGVHDLHVWSLSKDLRTLSAHVLTDDAGLGASDRLRSQIITVLTADYNIGHVTLQLECAIAGPGNYIARWKVAPTCIPSEVLHAQIRGPLVPPG